MYVDHRYHNLFCRQFIESKPKTNYKELLIKFSYAKIILKMSVLQHIKKQV